MTEGLKGGPRTKEQIEIYNTTQRFLIAYMLQRGVIKDITDYVERFAEVFEMLAEGVLETRRSMDVDKELEGMREKFKQLTKRTT